MRQRFIRQRIFNVLLWRKQIRTIYLNNFSTSQIKKRRYVTMSIENNYKMK